MKTTLYNHKEVGDLPTIPNVIYKGLLWMLENNEVEEAEYLYQFYSFTPYQKDLYNRIKIKHHEPSSI